MHDDLFVIFEEMVLGTPKPVLAGFFVILASLILTYIKQGADEQERRRRYHAPPTVERLAQPCVLALSYPIWAPIVLVLIFFPLQN